MLAHKGERESRIRELQRQVDQFSGSVTRLRATVDRLQTEVELRQILAPADGTIGEVANLPLGSVVSAGQRLGRSSPIKDSKLSLNSSPRKR